ncbi:putative peptide synthetase [Labilithrix luteola]|uniref:Putative peptide synthetase n=1 Tax=Labilithrix luteola TaxID=1391654 RepID=A0A0K1PNK0_9BACT|nr:hypothetical protein [Labilithrix luteola]AKU95092.1 putative peptide synthetase [Labilithrix luteola]
MTPRFERPLSSLERYALALDRVHRYEVVAVAEGEGDVDADRLRDAITSVAAVTPGLRARLTEDETSARWVGDGPLPDVREVDDSEWDGMSEGHTAFLDRRFDASSGPVAEVIIVRCRDDRTRLVFRGLHAAFDGRGLVHWASDIFRALRQEPLVGSSDVVTDDDIRRAHRKQTIESGIRLPKPAVAIPVLDHGGPIHPLAYVYRRVDIDHDVANLLGRAAVFLGQWAWRREAGAVSFVVPIDYRGLRTESTSIGNLVGYLRLPVEPADSPRAVIHRLMVSVRGYMDCRLLLPFGFDRQPLALLADGIRARQDTALYSATEASPSGSLVSMGAVAPAVISCPGFRGRLAFPIPPSSGKLGVMLVERPGGVTAVFSAPAAYNHRGQLDELVHAFREQLTRARSRG